MLYSALWRPGVYFQGWKNEKVVLRNLIVTAVVAVFIAMVFTIQALAGGTMMTTDKNDYSPGSKVYFNGKGYQPNETILVEVTGDTNDSIITTFAMADGSGAVSGSFDLSDYYEANYLLIATGLSSGIAAETTFKDCITLIISPANVLTLGFGQAQTYTVHASEKARGVPISWAASTGGTVSPSTGKTGNDGNFSTMYTAGSQSGTFTIVAIDTADSRVRAERTVTIISTVESTLLSVAPSSGTYVGTVNLSAILSPKVVGKVITFSFNGNIVGNALTDNNGLATLNNINLN